ncbi:MAG: hypothetical protein QF805_02715, partial [Pirellulaceae bacterium]|nr:hypothetical protein [Pirellulaceae bacterium]
MEISLAALLVLFAIAVGTGFVLVFTAGLGAGFRSSGLDLAPGWRIRCTTCGRSRRAAEAGVVRLGAVGTKRTLGKCSNCNALRWVAIE